MPRRRAPLPPVDVNIQVAGLLGDMAAIQASPQRKWGYKQAAAAIRELEQPLDDLAAAHGAVPRIPRIGPSSTRIIEEVLAGGASPTVEQAVDHSGKRAVIDQARALRQGFLSRAAVATVLDGAGRYRDYAADFQMHSTWSDGSQSLPVVIEGCLARGYSHAAISDHAVGLPIARGLSMDRFRAQAAEIATLNERYAGRFRLLRGVEANMLADGALDVAAEDRQAFELVLAAPHSALRTTEDQTARLLTAILSPRVHVLAHPRGRKFGARAGLAVEWPLVFAGGGGPRGRRRDRRRSVAPGSGPRPGPRRAGRRLPVRARQRRARAARAGLCGRRHGPRPAGRDSCRAHHQLLAARPAAGLGAGSTRVTTRTWPGDCSDQPRESVEPARRQSQRRPDPPDRT